MTNQASEDDLYNKLLNLRLTVWKQTNLNGQANLDHDSVEEVLAIIRTEKLKLLAEVRERVVGEDDNDLSGAHNELNHKFVGCVECQKNQLRADQRTVLTKLEAEL